ncbi:Membrane-anchored lipid-binding protein YSP2 [Wickerhamiella sorbophila]|uniref:Membrane-anchored lipid-binding protein YSP2 n=1 Tax=Wickerhamiella sorbophila TaxID=45607 RepID=A0A2T0FM90_9ASCO|nr:Membrane-anchored lipid-binding protein YSP2 [Wickerhamiella sorbophila]PRT56096.1 Membrane-anchored lipid-binding protein YSP2 [Wickerhamiella sorbophila]
MAKDSPAKSDSPENEDAGNEKVFKKFSSVLSSVWNTGDNGEEEAGAISEGEEVNEAPEEASEEAPPKAINSMGNGDATLDDFSSSDEGTADSESEGDEPGGSSKPLTIKDVLPQQQLASSKRNAEFHKAFPKIPASEPLIEDHSCALSRDILTQGKMYISPHYICFYSNILGWQVSETINLSQVVEVQAKSTFGVFPNGLTIVTLHQRHTFASLLSRDGVVDLITKLWKSPLNKQTPEGGNQSGSNGEDNMADNSDYSDNEDTNGDGKANGTSSNKWPVANLGPGTNKPTELPDVDPKEKIVANESINAPVGVVANLIFGKDTKWYRRLLADVEKNRDVPEIPQFKVDGGKEKRKYEYIKPLNAPVGPKQTKCLSTETIEDWNLKGLVTVITETRTPDVPSGNSFTTMSRVNLAWGPNNTTKFRMSTWIEWTGKSWIKGAIEKGALDGQVSYAKNLVKEINASLMGGKKAKSMKIKMSGKEDNAGQIAEADEHVESPGVLGNLNWFYISIFLLIVVIVLAVMFFRGRHAGGLDNKLRSIQEEYYLWQWIDGRMPVTSVRHQDFARADIEEAIRVMETRLLKLKGVLSN